ncbi:hypothetical protein [Bacillus sp. EB600]|uniref:hypothetical protein n=1 Tax=Bacillus sp. EB600 TaxID=2806345 RepID=UPI0021089FCA|nr:hypothetical protein [Bacillus sp. EB600]MCQ6280970.1 hypothetical protein [Bacillus sp. EB600]
MEEDKKSDGKVAEDPFSRMMFGSKSEVEENQVQQASLDYEELMVNIDSLIESAQNLKPLFHKVFPIIEQLWKKE